MFRRLTFPAHLAVPLGILFLIYMPFYLTLWPEGPVLTGDSRGYMAMAQDLSDFRLDSPTIRTPGYPLLLLIAGSSTHPMKGLLIVGLVLHFLAVCFLVTLLHSFSLRPRTLLFLAILMVLPPYVQSAGFVLTENFTELLLVSTFASIVLGLARSNDFLLIVGSLSAAASALVRPTYQLLAVAIIFTAWLVAGLMRMQNTYTKRSVRLTFSVAGGAVLLLGSYSTYYYKQFGYFGLSYAPGINLSDKTAKFVERLPAQYEPLRSLLIQFRDQSLVQGQSHTAEQYPWSHWTDLKAALNKEDVPLAKELAAANARLILGNPLNYLESVGSAIVGLWFPYTTPLATRGSTALQLSWSLLHFLLLGVFFLQLLVIVGQEVVLQSARLTHRREPDWEPDFEARAAYYFSLCFVVYTIVLSALADTGNARFRSPVDLLLIFNTVLGVRLWWQRLGAVEPESILETTDRVAA